MEIKLTEAQFKVLSQIQLEKQQLQAEYERVIKRETDSLILMAESAGVVITPKTKVELKDSTLFFTNDGPEDAVVVE